VIHNLAFRPIFHLALRRLPFVVQIRPTGSSHSVPAGRFRLQPQRKKPLITGGLGGRQSAVLERTSSLVSHVTMVEGPTKYKVTGLSIRPTAWTESQIARSV